jgi:hypothetical protein
METKLTTIQQLPLGELMNMAKMFAESGMFADTKTAAMAIVKYRPGKRSVFRSLQCQAFISYKVSQQ